MKRFVLIGSFIFSSVLAFAQTQADSINKKDAEGKRQGSWAVYKDNKIDEKGVYQDGKKTGIWKGWYPNGNLKFEITFDKGRQFGKAVLYYENGKVSEQGIWENNRWVGAYQMLYPNGNLQH